MMLINVSSSIEAIFRRSIRSDVMSHVSIFLDQHVALETRENSILDLVGRKEGLSHTARDVLSQFGFDASEIDKLMEFFKRQGVTRPKFYFEKERERIRCSSWILGSLRFTWKHRTATLCD